MKRRQANIDSSPKGARQAFPASTPNRMEVDQNDIVLQQTLLDDAIRNRREAGLNRNHNISNSNRNSNIRIKV